MTDLRTQIRRTGRYQRRRHVPAEHHLGCNRTGTEPAGFDETDPGKETYPVLHDQCRQDCPGYRTGWPVQHDHAVGVLQTGRYHPVEDAVKYLKDAVVTNYGKKGQKVVDMNNAAIDQGVSQIVKIDIPATWADATDVPEAQKDVPNSSRNCRTDQCPGRGQPACQRVPRSGRRRLPAGNGL